MDFHVLLQMVRRTGSFTAQTTAVGLLTRMNSLGDTCTLCCGRTFSTLITGTTRILNICMDFLPVPPGTVFEDKFLRAQFTCKLLRSCVCYLESLQVGNFQELMSTNRTYWLFVAPYIQKRFVVALHLQVLQSPKPVCCFWGINVETDPEYMGRSAEEEYVEGAEGEVESKYGPDHEDQLCPCYKASEKNLLARFYLELQPIKLQLCLSATMSKVMVLCFLAIPSTSSHSVPEADHYSACNPHGEELKVWTLLKVKELLRHHPQLPNPKLKMMMQLLKTMLQLLVQLNMFRDLSE